MSMRNRRTDAPFKGIERGLFQNKMEQDSCKTTFSIYIDNCRITLQQRRQVIGKL